MPWFFLSVDIAMGFSSEQVTAGSTDSPPAGHPTFPEMQPANAPHPSRSGTRVSAGQSEEIGLQNCYSEAENRDEQGLRTQPAAPAPPSLPAPLCPATQNFMSTKADGGKPGGCGPAWWESCPGGNAPLLTHSK